MGVCLKCKLDPCQCGADDDMESSPERSDESQSEQDEEAGSN